MITVSGAGSNVQKMMVIILLGAVRLLGIPQRLSVRLLKELRCVFLELLFWKANIYGMKTSIPLRGEV